MGRIARDLDALKKSVDELRSAQQQTAAKVTSLEAAHQQHQLRACSFDARRECGQTQLTAHRCR
jgi:hypothetical protein